MWFRGALFVVALGACYSPKIDTCSLTCAAEEVCPNGFECSNGRCAIEGTSCLSDGGADNNTAGCGDGTRMAGEVCFKPAVGINSGTTNIHDVQFVDGNGDGMRDLAFLGSAGFLFRLNAAGTFANVNTTGPAVPNALFFRAQNFNANNTPELIVQEKTAGVVQVWEWNGNAWVIGGMQASEMTDANRVDVGRLNGGGNPFSIVTVHPSRLRAYFMPGGGALSPITAAGSGVAITGGRDVATGDFDNNNTGEIAVATSAGVEVWSGDNNTLTKIGATLVGEPVDKVASCNVDGVAAADIVYLIAATGAGTSGRLGVARKTGASTFELTPPRTINGVFGALDCADFDDDGHADAVVAVADGNMNFAALVLRGRDDGTFESPIAVPILSTLTHIRANEDFNGDGQNDIVITSAALGGITILESDP